MSEKLVSCLHCHSTFNAAGLYDGPHYVEAHTGKWCPQCKGPLNREAVGTMSFAYGTVSGGGDTIRASMLENVGKWEDENLKEREPKPREGYREVEESAGDAAATPA